MKIFRILLLLLFVYLAFVVFTFPASFATSRINAAVPQVQVKGVDGTIWSGGASDIHYQGIAIGALDWKAQPLGVFQGEWKNHLVLNGIVDGEGELAYGIDGEVNLYDMTLNTTFSKLIGGLDKRIPEQMKQFQGEMQADIVKLAVEPQSKKLVWLEGAFFLNKLQLSDGHYLGDFAAEVTTIETEKFRTEVRSTSDRGLQLQGVVIATQQGEVEIDIRLAKVEVLGKQAASLIQRFMQKTDDGYYRFQWQGNVKYLMMLLG
jgi:hypothetical protein